MKKSNEIIVEVLNVSPARITPIYVPAPFDDVKKVFVVGKDANGNPKEYPATREVSHRGEETWHIDASAPMRVDTNDLFEVSHGQVYDLNDPVSRFRHDIMIADEHVADSKDKVNPSRHTHYIYNRETDAISVVTKADLAFEAMTYVQTLNDVDRRDFAFYHRQSVREMSEQQIMAYVKGVAHHQPELVLKYKGDRSFKERAFIQRLVQFGIIVIEAGQYRMPGGGGEVLGIDEQAMVHWVHNVRNQSVVKQWYNALAQQGEDLNVLDENAK